MALAWKKGRYLSSDAETFGFPPPLEAKGKRGVYVIHQEVEGDSRIWVDLWIKTGDHNESVHVHPGGILSPKLYPFLSVSEAKKAANAAEATATKKKDGYASSEYWIKIPDTAIMVSNRGRVYNYQLDRTLVKIGSGKNRGGRYPVFVFDGEWRD